MTAEKNEAFPTPKAAVVKKAREEGIADAIKESTKDAYKRGADEGYGEGEDEARTWVGTADIMNLLPVLDLGLDAFKDAIDEKADMPITEARVAGLLEAERSGRNRTEYVKALMKRLGVKHVHEVTTAGPAFTVDTTNISDL
jgi:hypothetical protein